MTIRKLRDPDALLTSPIEPTNAELNESFSDVWQSYVKPLLFEVSADYTTTGGVPYETVLTSGASDITVSLSRDHTDGDRVRVVWNGSGTISVDTEGSETILGATSRDMLGKYHYLTFYKESNWFVESEYKPGFENLLFAPILNSFGAPILNQDGEVILG